MKKTKKILSLVLVIAMCLSMSAMAAQSEVSITLGEIENQVVEYVEENYPEIVCGSGEYAELLLDIMLFDSDEVLKSTDNYSDVRMYISYYISEINNTISELKENDIFMLSEDAKSLTIDDLEALTIIQNTSDYLEYSNSQNAFGVNVLSSSSYSASAAVTYARTWAESQNSNYPYYGGIFGSGDCTNYVSQCLVAGGISMRMPSAVSSGTYDTTSYWYSYLNYYEGVVPMYNDTTSFIRVADLYSYMAANGATIITNLSLSQLLAQAQIGDVVQISNGTWYHSIIITGGSGSSLTYCGHSTDRLDVSVSNLSSSNTYRIIRL